jgi:hypothetical protein
MPILGKMILVAPLLALAACAEPWPEQYAWPGGDPYVPELAYCYVTLANTNCYAEPQAGQAYRQVGRAAIAPY